MVKKTKQKKEINFMSILMFVLFVIDITLICGRRWIESCPAANKIDLSVIVDYYSFYVVIYTHVYKRSRAIDNAV